MQREDPFFATRKPHRNGYLETMHRTYGEPAGALPTRGGELFNRAYAFRQKEKAKYAQMERESAAARESSEKLLTRYTDLQKELEQIKPLFEQLSKQRVDDVRSGATKSADSGVRDLEHAIGHAGDSGGSVPVQAADEGKAVGKEVGGVVPVGVLRGGGDVRGQADEHAAEGPEPGSGVAEAAESADAGERVLEAAE